MKLIKSLNELNINAKDFPIFFWDEWLAFEKNRLCEVFFYFDEENKAVIPFKVHTLKFLKKADYIYVPLNIEGKNLKSDSEKLVIERFHAFLKNNKICDVIFPPQHICNFKSVPQKVLFYKLGIIYIDISEEESSIFDKMSASYRTMIRKALKSSVNIVFDLGLLTDFYALYVQTHLRQNLTPEPILTFERITKKFSNNSLIGVSTLNSSIESSVFNIFDLNSSYYLYGGTSDKTILPGSNKLLFWESIKIFKGLGVKKFILGGYRNSKETDNKHNGIQNFKLRFGANIEEGFHFIKVINPLRYNLFAFALKVKSLLVGKDLGFINKSGLEIKKSK